MMKVNLIFNLEDLGIMAGRITSGTSPYKAAHAGEVDLQN